MTSVDWVNDPHFNWAESTWGDYDFLCRVCFNQYSYFCDKEYCSPQTGKCKEIYHSMAECHDCVLKRTVLIKING